MIDFLIEKFHDTRFMAMLLAAIAVTATAYTLITPLLAGENLGKRMKAVANERERMKQRERERLNRNEKVALRQAPRQLVQKAVTDFNLTKWLAQESARDKLVMAGYRGSAPYTTFLFFRLVTPIAFLLGSTIYIFLIANLQQTALMKLAMCVGAAYLGMQAPMLFLRNAISKRQLSIKRAFPDALDLLLISRCSPGAGPGSTVSRGTPNQASSSWFCAATRLPPAHSGTCPGSSSRRP